MARKRKQTGLSPLRIGVLVALIVLVAAVLLWPISHRIKMLLPQRSDGSGNATSAGSSAARDDSKASAGDGIAMRKSGRLEIRHPPRDAQIGVTAEAIILLRIVEMYQWHERCELAGGACSYTASWSPGHVDSAKFRDATGHGNPPAPFADARFVAGEIRLGDLIVDPKLLETQAAQDYPVKASALPPNMAATFNVVDGVLYAGGDAAHPQVGTVRVRYRIVPAGEVELAGVKRGNRLDAK
jgi:hypothetical protein